VARDAAHIVGSKEVPMYPRAPGRLALVVAASLVIGGLHAARASVAPAGSWTITGSASARYRYEGRHGRIDYPFATHIVVHADGTIDGVVSEPSCDASEPITFTGRWHGGGRAGLAAALRAFVTACYGADAHLGGVRGRVRLSADATRFTGEFGARLRLPIAGEHESVGVRLHGVVDGRRDG
jgi:hypothetical protein